MMLCNILFVLPVLVLFKSTLSNAENAVRGASHKTHDVDPPLAFNDLLVPTKPELFTPKLNDLLLENVKDPVPLENFKISNGGCKFTDDITGQFSNIYLRGLKGLNLTGASINNTELSASAKAFVPTLTIVGDYSLQAGLAFLPLFGEGTFYITLSSVFLKGRVAFKNSPSGRLVADNINLSSYVREMDVLLENHKFGTTWNSIASKVRAELSSVIQDKLKPSLLKELESYIRSIFDGKLYQHSPSVFIDTTMINPVDNILKQTSSFLGEKSLEPLPSSDHKETSFFGKQKRLVLVNKKGEVKIFNGTLHEVSTPVRKGDVITVFDNNTLIFEADFEFQNLRDSNKWLVDVLDVDKPDSPVNRRSRRETNEVDPLASIKDLLRQARTDSGDIDLNALMSENVNDPVPLEDFNVSSSGFISEIFGRFSDLQLHGLKGFVVDRLAINLAEMNLSAEMSVPMLSIVGDYFLQGSVTFLPLSGEGPFYMNLSSIVLKGHSIIKNSPNGRLIMDNINLRSDVGKIDLQFENLMGGGTWGSISNSILNQLSELILGELKPSLLRELASYLKYVFDDILFQQLPPGFMDPTSANLVDSILEQSSSFMKEKGLEPLPLPDYKEIYEKRLLFVNTRGELNIFNGTLHGLSTLVRKGDVITVFANNSLIFEADFEFENLTGSYEWLADILGAEKQGRMDIQVKSVEGFIKIKQELKVGSRLELDKFHIKGIRHVWLDLQGLGNWDYVMESIINLITNGLKLQLADAIAVPLEESIQEQLNHLNLISTE